METIEEQLREAEELLFQPVIRRSAEAVSRLLADEFCEFGSSGRRFTKQEIVEALQKEAAGRISIQDFQAHILASGVALVTYQATRQAAPNQVTISLRSSLWVRREERWQMLFHQGTMRQ
jgi:hypothetical protein